MRWNALRIAMVLGLILAGACSPTFSKTKSTPTPPLLPATSPTPETFSPTGELQFPIRAAFYYPWFPEAWKQQGMNPFTHYYPDLGLYSQDNIAIVLKQISAMQYGKIQVGISSWWGQNSPTDKRFSTLLNAGSTTNFHWVLYVESEGVGNPNADSIHSDLEYIKDNFASSPAYLKIGGRFVVFVYSDSGDRCDMANRWTSANTVGAYLVLKEFVGYRKCSAQPDGWHQYAPAKAAAKSQSFSYTISPGFWKASESEPRLARNLDQWSNDIQAMIASKSDFQLITTFNEWGEGTSVESSDSWASPSQFGTYLDALHYDGKIPFGLIPPDSGISTSPK
jgi:hypothetical protein